MNRRQTPPPLAIRNPAYRRAVQRLEEALAKNSVSYNAEKINLVRQALFGVVAESPSPRTVEPPQSTADA
jgi:hypothetical protein